MKKKEEKGNEKETEKEQEKHKDKEQRKDRIGQGSGHRACKGQGSTE